MENPELKQTNETTPEIVEQKNKEEGAKKLAEQFQEPKMPITPEEQEKKDANIKKEVDKFKKEYEVFIQYAKEQNGGKDLSDTEILALGRVLSGVAEKDSEYTKTIGRDISNEALLSLRAYVSELEAKKTPQKDISPYKKAIEILTGELKDKGNLEKSFADLKGALEGKGDLTEEQKSLLEGLNDKQKKVLSEIMKKAENFGQLKKSDIYVLADNGIDIGQLFLKGYKKDLVAGDELEVNFSNFGNLNANVGLGYLLPLNVYKVEVTSKDGVVSIGTLKGRPRPGYYTENGAYIPVFDDYKVKILENREMTEEELNGHLQAKKDRLKEIRLEDTLANTDENGKCKPLTDSDYDKELAEKAEELKKLGNFEGINAGNSAREALKESMFRDQHKDMLKRCQEMFNLPIDGICYLISKESNFNPNARPPQVPGQKLSAYGYGQLPDATWSHVQEMAKSKGVGFLDRHNPDHQIFGCALYLRWVMNTKSCSLADGMIYYHTGPGVKDDLIPKYMQCNPGIAKRMNPPYNTQSYIAAAKTYYQTDRFSGNW